MMLRPDLTASRRHPWSTAWFGWLVRPVLALAMVFAVQTLGIAAPAKHPSRQEQAFAALRDYALSSCLRQAFPAIADEADAAKDFYLQNGTHSAETYQAIQSMAAEWLKQDYPSFRDVKLSIVKCLDFADSRDVANLARHPPPPGQ